ncbi:hypothetical protein B0J13DRAFT_442103, partial [Dactylonectria estremocensis]
LITILLIDSSKSLVFIMPIMLTSAKVTIVIALYIKLKQQLVTYYINASFNYKNWPKVYSF